MQWHAHDTRVLTAENAEGRQFFNTYTCCNILNLSAYSLHMKHNLTYVVDKFCKLTILHHTHTE